MYTCLFHKLQPSSSLTKSAEKSSASKSSSIKKKFSSPTIATSMKVYS